MHVMWCSASLSPCSLSGYCSPLCPFVRPSVCYAISSLTIGQNPTKFGVRVIHMSGCATAFFGHPPGARGGFKGQLLSLKSQFQRFLYQTFLFVLTNKEMGFSLCRLGHTPGERLGVAVGSKFYFFQTWSCGISN